jgi:hypothetical protein
LNREPFSNADITSRGDAGPRSENTCS